MKVLKNAKFDTYWGAPVVYSEGEYYETSSIIEVDCGDNTFQGTVCGIEGTGQYGMGYNLKYSKAGLKCGDFIIMTDIPTTMTCITGEFQRIKQ